MDKLKKNNRVRGITLIALVITIIVLLILAGISISMLAGDNSILKQATEAKEKTTEKANEEQIKIAIMEAAVNLEETKFNEINIPVGCAPTRKNGESTIDEGLVITDSKGNEYVWIEVPTTAVDNTVTGGPDYTEVESAEENSTEYYNAIADALREYCTKDANGADFIKIGTSSDDYKTTTLGEKDIWYDSLGKSENTSTNLNDTEGCGLTNENYIKLYRKMLKSVYKNGGFWIGRYEAGTTVARSSKTETIDELIPLSKSNLYPINYVTCAQAQKIASRMTNIGNCTSSLMFGIQWDLVLRFLSNKGVETNILVDDSSSWGNYSNQQFIINRGKYSIVDPWNEYIDYNIPTSDKVIIENGVSKKMGTSGINKILLTTGAADINCKKNIYDLAGNVTEWTLGKSSNNNYPSAVRGGILNSTGSMITTSSHLGTISSNSSFECGFRITIY